MWGPNLIGFGTHHYVYESGRQGDTVAVGFAPRKAALVLYGLIHDETNGHSTDIARRLGPHTHGKGCLYVKKLADLDQAVLETMITEAFKARNNVPTRGA